MLLSEIFIFRTRPDFFQGVFKHVSQDNGIIINGREWGNATWQHIAVGGNVHQGQRPIALAPWQSGFCLPLQAHGQSRPAGGVKLDAQFGRQFLALLN